MRTGKKKPYWFYYLISYFFACFNKFIGRSDFCLIENLTNSLAMGRTKLRGEEVAISFSG